MEANLVKYFCSLSNHDAPERAPPKHLFSNDDSVIEAFIKREDRPGRGVFSAIGLYDPGTTSRSAATTRAVPFVVCDCDLKNMAEGREDVLAVLRDLALPPSWIHDSGFGLRAGWDLKEPLTTDEDMRRAEVVMQRLAVLLAGDPAPTNRASLYRYPGTHNTKNGEKRPCHVIEATGAPYDITELEEMLDLYGHPLLRYAPGKAPKGKGNGHAGNGFDFAADDGPVDVEARLLAMSHKGAGASSIHFTQLNVTASLTGAGRPIEETVARVLAATQTAVANDPRCAGWDWAKEEADIAKMCFDLINKAMAKNGEDLGCTLPDKLYDQWSTALAAGKRPAVARNAAGLHVRSYPWERAKSAGTAEEATGADGAGANDGANANNGEPPKKKEYRFKLIHYSEMRPGAEHSNYLIDELLPAKGIVLLWGPPKCLKSFFMLTTMYHVVQGWEFYDRAVQQGTVVYCAFEGAHGYHKRIEALRREYGVADDDRAPLYVMTINADLIKDHVRLASDMRGQLEDVQPAVVVLDTLNKSLVGSESKDIDMAAYVRAAEAIRDKFECLVIIVHHCGWDESRERGHSSLRGAVDAVLSVTREGKVVTVTVEHMRDGPEGVQIVGEAKVKEVGVGARGELLTSLVIVPRDDDGITRPTVGTGGKWPRSLRMLHDAIVEATLSAGVDHQIDNGPKVKAADLASIRDAFCARYVVTSHEVVTKEQMRNTRQRAFARAMEKGQAMSLIGVRAFENGRQLIWLAVTEHGYA